MPTYKRTFDPLFAEKGTIKDYIVNSVYTPVGILIQHFCPLEWAQLTVVFGFKTTVLSPFTIVGQLRYSSK